jgi:protein-S-isoprenylcysteine O-methyltransferase Ste14
MPNRLVVAGPYRWVRNPMALASIAQGVAVGLILSSWLVVVYAVAGALLWPIASSLPVVAVVARVAIGVVPVVV